MRSQKIFDDHSLAVGFQKHSTYTGLGPPILLFVEVQPLLLLLSRIGLAIYEIVGKFVLVYIISV